jgi:valyl-tRNA synthetase
VLCDRNWGVKPDKKCKVILKSVDPLVQELVDTESSYIMQLARAESVELIAQYTADKTDAIGPFSKGEIALPLSGILDFAKEKERLLKEKNQLEEEIQKIDKKISNPGFLEKAKPEVVEKEKQKIQLYQEKKDVIEKAIDRLGN